MNFVNSMAFTAITFVVALISWWKTRGDNLDTQDGYYLGGRSLTGPVIAGSLLMTNLSAEQLVGNNGQAVRVGMSTMGWEVTSAIALVILAFVLMPKYLKTGLQVPFRSSLSSATTKAPAVWFPSSYCSATL